MAEVQLLGDAVAAARYLPIAHMHLSLMQRQIQLGGSVVPVRHLSVDGARIDVWAHRHGGRIVIESDPIGDLFEWGSRTLSWRVFSSVMTAGAVSVIPLFDESPFGHRAVDATILNFAMWTGTVDEAMVLFDATGARKWESSNTRQNLPVLPAWAGEQLEADGGCVAGSYVVFADGWSSKTYPLNPDAPEDGDELVPATLRYVVLGITDGATVLDVPTDTATVWGDTEPVFVALALAGAVPLFDTFHVVGARYEEGTDFSTDHLALVGHELQHKDPASLDTLATVTLAEAPKGLTVDDQGMVYVEFGDATTRRFEAYTRDLDRVPENDFDSITVDAGHDYRFAIIGAALYVRVGDPTGTPVTLRKFNRAAELQAEFSIASAIFFETTTPALFVRRRVAEG